MKVLHIITGLSTGGAEMMLYKLLSEFRNEGPESEVITLAPNGAIAPQIVALGIPVTSVNMTGPLSLHRMVSLTWRIRAARADLVHCWMYHANLLGGIAARFAGRRAVLWGLRQSTLDPRLSKRSTIAVAKLGARLSRRIPDRILCVSETARMVHAGMGYNADRMIVIPNGFDLDLFRPDAEARASVRAELGIARDAPLVGLIARFDPQKDHATFLQAAARLIAARPEVQFLLAGEHVQRGNPALDALVNTIRPGGHIHCLGPREDIPRLTAALDVAVSSSAWGEGFSNALGEALCCGVPVATTDVGDSAAIAGAEGRVVPPVEPLALAQAIGALLDIDEETRARLGRAGRERMGRDFSLAAIARRYRTVYDDLVRPAAP